MIEQERATTLRVLHLLPVDLARGAQHHARALRARLDGEAWEHRSATLFASSPGALQADVTLSVPSGALRRALDPRAVRALGRLLKQWQPDVLVAHGSEPLKYAVLCRGRHKLVYHKIGTARSGIGAVARAFQRWIIGRADHVVAVSTEAAREATEVYGADAGRVTVVPNGRDPEVFAPARGDSTGDHVVFVGHLTSSKRPDVVLDVVNALRSGGRSVTATLAGDGPLLASLQSRAAHIDGVIVAGRSDDVPGLQRSADVFLFTSRPEGEGLPGALIEAGLSGVPIVTTHVPGARDVVLDGRTGYVLEQDDLPGLVDRVADLLGDAEQRRSMGDAGRAHCLERFTIAASVAGWRQVLERLVPVRG